MAKGLIFLDFHQEKRGHWMGAGERDTIKKSRSNSVSLLMIFGVLPTAPSPEIRSLHENLGFFYTY